MVKNQWKPDTCGCILEYEFDADASEDVRVHTPTRTVKACEHHPDTGDVVAHHDSVLAENQMKNRAWEEVKSKVDPAVKAEVAWAFDQDRKLVITLPESEKGKGITTKEEGVILQ